MRASKKVEKKLNFIVVVINNYYVLITMWIHFKIVLFNVAPHRACKPWIFIINGVLCFLKINGSEMEKEKQWLETPLQGEDESRTSSPPYEAMDKNLKVGEDEWTEREREMKFWEREKGEWGMNFEA